MCHKRRHASYIVSNLVFDSSVLRGGARPRRQLFDEDRSRGSRSSAPLTNAAALCVPNVRHGQVGSGLQFGRGPARLDPRGVRPAGERQCLTWANVRSGLVSRGRAGRIRTGDPLTPRTMRHAPPATTATTGTENLEPPRRVRRLSSLRIRRLPAPGGERSEPARPRLA